MFCPFNAQLIITTYVVYFLRQVKKLGVNKERTHVYVYLHSGAIINGRMVSVCVNYWGVLTLALTVNGGNSTKKFNYFYAVSGSVNGTTVCIHHIRGG